MLQAITLGVDHRLMRRLHRWNAPRWIRLWMVCATRGGDGWLWFALAAVLFVFGGERAVPVIVAATSAAAAGVAVFVVLKRATGRRRPCHIEPHCWSTLLPPDRFSFPSGHTITAFSIVTPVTNAYPELAAVMTFCALSIASSRILLGMHFLTDVLAGAVLGSALGLCAMRVFAAA